MMNEGGRRRFYRRTLLGVWAMFTLVLVFCIAILLNAMSEQGVENPLAPVPRGAGESAPAPVETVESRDVTLYFANREARGLVGEPRAFERTNSTIENCRAILEELARGPRTPLVPILPTDTVVRGIYMIEQGQLVIDLSREVEQGIPKSTSAEGLMVYGIVNTLTQEELAGDEGPVRRVRFLFEGAGQDRFPRHIDVTSPVSPNDGWLIEQEPT